MKSACNARSVILWVVRGDKKNSPFKLSEDDLLSLNVYLYQSQSCVTAENSDLVAIYVFFMERNRSCKSGPGNPQVSANNCDFWGTKKIKICFA